jgi:protease I
MPEHRLNETALDGTPHIAILLESDFYEPEIFYYQKRFAEAGFDVDFLSRLWGQQSLTFTGHEYRAPFTVSNSLEDVSDEELRRYQAVVVPSGMVADRLRYSEAPDGIPPATALMRRAFAEPGIVKGVICHGMWLLAKVPELVRGRAVTCHNNLVGDVRNMGAEYVDSDVVVDGDLVTGRTGETCHLFAHELIRRILAQRTLS